MDRKVRSNTAILSSQKALSGALFVVVAVEIVVVGTPRTEGAEGGCGGAP
jgi:hypothetical protein